jgi:predicted membrane channel-forming protein YqfA (hemolysin III family)
MCRRCTAPLPHLPTCSREQAPAYSKVDYPYITRGFIRPGFRVVDGLATLWSFNNETMNVLTQLVGLLYFVAVFFSVKTMPPHTLIHSLHVGSHELEYRRFLFELCILSDCVCCTLSLICHMYQSNSERWNHVLSVLDWGGSILVILTSSISVDLAGLSDAALPSWLSPEVHIIATVSIFLFLLWSFVAFNTSHGYRFGSIFAVVLVAVTPFIINSWALSPSTVGTGIAAFGVAGFFFSSHIPERFVPGTFDLLLPSHSLWHVGYLIGLYCSHRIIALGLFGHYDFMSVPSLITFIAGSWS